MVALKHWMTAAVARCMATSIVVFVAACGPLRLGPSRTSAASEFRVYVSNEDSNSVSVIDPVAQRVLATVPVGKRPRGLKLAADGQALYVALSGSPKAGPASNPAGLAAPERSADGVGIVDLATGRLTRVLASGPDPESFDLTPDGRSLYAANEESAVVSRVELAAGKVTSVIAVGKEPEGVAVRPDGKVVYVTSEQDNSVSVIDATSQHVLRTIAVGRRPRSVLFTRDGAKAFVSNELGASVSVLDAAQHRLIGEIAIGNEGTSALGAKPMGLALSPDGRWLYVSTGRGGTVCIIDVAQQRVSRVLAQVGIRPWGIAVSPDGKQLYAANGPSNDVSVIDLESGRLTARIAVGSSPWGAVIGPATPLSKLSAQDSAATPHSPADDGQWAMVAKDPQNTRFSGLRQIDTSNVATLQVAWSFETGIPHGHEAAPLVIGDTLYLVTPYPNNLYALDLRKAGAPVKWVYKAEPAAAAQGVACCDVVNRGAAYANGKIFFNTLDVHTVAVDAASGQLVWKRKLGEINQGESMTMAPLVVGTRVLVGNSGGEFGVRGWLTALDAESGATLWRAYSTGPDQEVLIGAGFRPYYSQDRGSDLGVSSWPPGRWQTGGGTVWGFVSYDPELDAIYYGTGNPGPWNGEQRAGDNEWTSGIFARRPSTGEALWFYQWSPHDLFDYDGINESIVVDLSYGGRPRKLLLHADRNGYVYVLDRSTGQVLSATAFAPITTSRGVDLKSGRLLAVAAKEPHLGQVVRGICPAAPGAKDWQPGAFSPATGLLYLPHNNLCEDIEGTEANYIAGTPYVGANVRMYAGPGGQRGRFTAWDPIAARKVWAIEEEFPVWSGALATAGELVFYGTMDGWFKAVHARTGQLLFGFHAASGFVGQPITYRGPDGKQYVVIASGVGGWAGAPVVAGLDPRDQSAALGFGHAMRDLPAHTRAGSTLYAFALP
jgi:PQQ-dependent dehydrogenase (methanol/ethanol family)